LSSMTTGLLLVRCECRDMRRVLHLLTLVVSAGVRRDDVLAIEDADASLRRDDGECALDVGVRDGIVVEIETNVRRLAGGDFLSLLGGVRVIREREEPTPLLLESLSHGQAAVLDPKPIGGRALAPSRGLRV